MNQTFPLSLSESTRAQRIAFIQGHWHGDIVGRAREAFFAELAGQGISEYQVDVFTVSGAYEIPLQAQVLAASGRYGAIVCAGLVVDGGLYRHEFVAQAVIEGMMRVQLDSGVPVISAVLTPHHFHEHETHQAFFSEHFVSKGREAAQACLQTLENHHRLRTLSER
ncbi:6,7-dimethyl-8-ribityllumazine synthase [Alloalcanivorax mobilis]|uniref:6,7-dimethyl-8-ribityllumazine synthase n=1 Tax=Alloalcanivorax mobilis TaxID=2019569 RepID=UPI000C77EF49|nr:6,7-dimethyl-8-ribityllumazine synthase [Alloalcanivorax mobilis]